MMPEVYQETDVVLYWWSLWPGKKVLLLRSLVILLKLFLKRREP